MVLVSLLTAFIVPVAWISRAQIDGPSARLDAALRHAQETVKRCRVVDAREAAALHVYLAIEDYFRPAYLRNLEFMVERLGSALGVNVVRTLGVGQISRATYLGVMNGDAAASRQADQWASSVRDDCLSIAILVAYASQRKMACDGEDPGCEIALVCLWHTGKADGCRGNMLDEAYLSNALATLVRLRKAG